MNLLSILLLLATTLAAPAAPVMRVLNTARAGTPLLQNGGFEDVRGGQPASWRSWGKGFRLAPGEGRAGSAAAIVCERGEGDGEFGASQTLTLDRTNVAPLVIRGWSKAEAITGSPDSGYSLYADIVYADGTPLWGQTANFRCGTHDWERREFVLLPDKPIKTLTLHCLFRGHTGKVWFDDVSLEEIATPAGAVMFQGVPVEARRAPVQISRLWDVRQRTEIKGETMATRDGLELTLSNMSIVSLRVNSEELAAGSAAGFLARDFAANSDVFAFTNGACEELGLRLEGHLADAANHLVFAGRVTDTTGRDRAVTLLFALPIDATGWQWGDDVRQSRVIGGDGEFAGTVNLHSGANGKMSRYPLAAIWNERTGLALALDMDHPAQYRLVYHAGTKQFFIAYDFGLAKETAKFPSSTDFRFVLFRFDPRWGFRAALQKFYDIFPQQFTKRVKREGVWMPFTDIAKVPDFEDFGFAFQEGAPNVAFDDRHGIASFVYVEPMSYWLALPPEAPRTYDSAMAVVRKDLTGARGKEKQQMAAATLASGIHNADGRFPLYLVKAPWCDGGVFTLNPNPHLPAGAEYPFTKASVMRDAIAAAFAKNRPATNAPGAGLDGVYFDSFEMSATELNSRREHFQAAGVPLVFDRDARPCQLMVFNTWEFARDIAAEMHAQGRFTFANAVLWNYSFPAPLMDVLGTEVNWLHQGAYQPDSDAVMNFRRALCHQKPYCLLLNTDYEKFTPAFVERYFQRCLFYGVWPGFFDQEAASKDPYWASSKRWYDRDRATFKKFIPLLQRVTAVGWQPITAATCDDPKLWLERFGDAASGKFLLTAVNDTTQPQEGVVELDRDLPRAQREVRVVELLSGEALPKSGAGWRIHLAPQAVAVLEFTH
jgi:hypothetical protein